MNPRSMSNNFPKLREAGVITDVTPKTITVTAMGMKHAVTDGLVSAAPTNHIEHQEKLMNKYKLNGSEKNVVLEIADGRTAKKTDVTDSLKLKIRSFGNLLAKLKKAGMLDESVGKDEIRLSDKMFHKKLGRPCDEK